MLMVSQCRYIGGASLHGKACWCGFVLAGTAHLQYEGFELIPSRSLLLIGVVYERFAPSLKSRL